MKLLFFSCLTILTLLANAQAAEYSPALQKEIELTQLAEKPLFKKLLSKIAAEKEVCPLRLFSMGITQWDKIPAEKYESELRILAGLIKHLN